ncbi:MAG: HAD-IA family hydrolase [Patescibacteria group bacterium]
MLSKKSTIIFDFDGTLVDTMHIFADVASDLISANYSIEKDRARKMYFETSGFPFHKQLEIMFPGLEMNKKIAPLYETQKLDATADIGIDRETREALSLLKKSGYDLVISSNNFQYNIDNFINGNKLAKIFALALGHRPSFSKGLEHFSHIALELAKEKEEMIFIGDSLNDARLAKEYGIDFVGKLGTFKKQDFVKLDNKIKVIKAISDLIS